MLEIFGILCSGSISTPKLSKVLLLFLPLVESPLVERRFSSAVAAALDVSSDTDWYTVPTVSCKVFFAREGFHKPIEVIVCDTNC